MSTTTRAVAARKPIKVMPVNWDGIEPLSNDWSEAQEDAEIEDRRYFISCYETGRSVRGDRLA